MDEPDNRDHLPPIAEPPPRSSFAGLLRLWTLRDATGAAGPSVRFLAALGCAWLFLWLAIDWWQVQPDAQFMAGGVPLLAWYALAILALAELLRVASMPRASYLGTLMLSLALVPLPLLVAVILAPILPSIPLLAAVVALSIYVFIFFARGLRSITGRSQRRAALLGVVFFAGFVWVTDALDVIPDVWAGPEVEEAADGNGTQADAEALLFDQSARIDAVLAAIKPDAAAAPKGFFLGFAGVGDQKVFTQEIGLASRVLSERYAMEGRSLSLLNDERDLERAPLATVSGLKYALRGLAGRMNVERDVLFLAISSHGARDPAIAVSNADLPLDELTDEDLAEALEDSKIKWRVIIISACYAGGFIESLKDARTIVIAAAAADRTSFGCSNDSDLTYFGEAFYRDALPEARSLRDAFDKAKAAIALRERREHVEASKPQAFFGAEMEAKLAAMKDHAP
jgi:peptidase C13-like protein